MAKSQKAELRVVLRRGRGFVRLYTVKLEGDELYRLNHHELIGGKSSYHSSGVQTRETDLLNLRDYSASDGSDPLRDTRSIRFIGGVGFGANPSGLAASHLKSDTRRRKTLILEDSEEWEKRASGLYVWALPQGYVDVIPQMIETRPWPTCPNVGAIAADWTNPALLITVWRAETATPYAVYKMTPGVKGRVPFEIVPAHYEDTWLDWTANGDRVRWRPGDPWPPDDPLGVPQAPPRPQPPSGLWAPPA